MVPNMLNELDRIFSEAMALHAAGRLAEAEPIYRRVLQIEPGHADSLHLLGALWHQAGRHDLAANLIKRAIIVDPGAPEFHSNLGLALTASRRLPEALRAGRRAVRLRPDYVDALNNLGLVLQEQGNLAEAMQCYAVALSRRPDLAQAHYNAATCLYLQHDIASAIRSYQAALVCTPDHADAHSNLGAALQEGDAMDAAAIAYDRALALCPDHGDAHANVGKMMQARGMADAARTSYRRALAAQPANAEAHNSLGTLLKDLGQLDLAERAYRRALACQPDYAEAHNNLGVLDLLLGRFASGWSGYDWRWNTRSIGRHNREFAMPQWAGEPLRGRGILLHSEQGIGDTIQFCRYAPLLAARGAKVMLEVHRHVARLLQGLAGVERIVVKGETLPAADYHCPLMSLPRLFGTELHSVPAEVPYLAAEPERVEYWRSRLPQAERRIGVVWQGNPAYGGDRDRSVALRHFAALAEVPGVALVSLQKQHGLEQLADLPPGMRVATLGVDFDEGADAFIDSAAVMMSLDLVIAIDSAAIHLAGALARPAWLPLAANPHWVWMLGRDDSPWYPSLRLFRQARPGEWPDVFRRMADRLRTGRLQ
jgi:tetratricopeptide (TPR) repeat protein